jgi:GNAT superfamily N-acetyltransferase
MTRRALPLTGEEVENLPAACRRCRYWELGVRPELRAGDGTRSSGVVRDAEADKRAWVRSQVDAGTPPGRVLRMDGNTVAYALFGPAESFARRGTTRPPPSPDALLLATLWVAPNHRGFGLGRLMVQEALKEALRIERPALEVYGDRRWAERVCHLPATWLLREGFTVMAEHPRTPLLRIETTRLARWAESIEHAWEEVLGHLPRRVPIPHPEPGRRAPVPGAGTMG